MALKPALPAIQTWRWWEFLPAAHPPKQGPELAALFNTVASFDTHARIPEHFAAVDAPALANQKTALISAGWDPGMFSINRAMGEALLPDGATYTLWGKGLSQGHSDAIRRIPGVAGGVQYTLTVPVAVEKYAAARAPSCPPGKSTRANALRCSASTRTQKPCAKPSSPCRITLTSTTPPSTSSAPKFWPASTTPCRTAVL
ncbi:meso-diaminopimelate D-dehydrogenase [Rhodoferax antarcticus ANT.BR]|uniref:Meso-diaminopimelate D-dehydrogenase n=1 Tax=Rhodoferax antarcticus ANT.BR TaxID=1111071 RepID=A0A1Q8YK98_9BURK|nr:meso-diaminopimelate D-dehydrogenase [Rhodoferax antarcticus ANT.BR]